MHDSGIGFGWDKSSAVAQAFMFGAREAYSAMDIRSLIGLRGFGPGGRSSETHSRLWMLGSLSGVDPDEVFLFDSWSFVSFLVVTDPYNGTYALQYELVEAVFDSAIPDPTIVERFMLEGWFGVGAVWKTGYSPAELTEAMFDSGATNMEEFVPAEWPGEIWT